MLIAGGNFRQDAWSKWSRSASATMQCESLWSSTSSTARVAAHTTPCHLTDLPCSDFRGDCSYIVYASSSPFIPSFMAVRCVDHHKVLVASPRSRVNLLVMGSPMPAARMDLITIDSLSHGLRGFYGLWEAKTSRKMAAKKRNSFWSRQDRLPRIVAPFWRDPLKQVQWQRGNPRQGRLKQSK